MSLDVWLTAAVDTGGPEPHVVTLFEANITHNLNVMADAAGIYDHLWRPETLGIDTAAWLIQPLEVGLAKMRADPAGFRLYDASNGWGAYDDFVPWIECYLEACKRHPAATVNVSR